MIPTALNRLLLSDRVHLNTHGEWLMAESVKAYLRCDPALGPSPAEDWVKTYEVGKDVKWADGKLRVYRPPLGREETR